MTTAKTGQHPPSPHRFLGPNPDDQGMEASPTLGDLKMTSIKTDFKSITLTSYFGVTKTVAQWMKANDIHKIYEIYGYWAVTDYGIECLTSYYPIQAARLWEGEPQYGWAQHMSQKQWVVLEDFEAALEAAREIHAKHKPEAR